jgi:hypothetical protein
MSIVCENFRILLRPGQPLASQNLIWCVQFAVEPPSVRRCTSVVQYVPSESLHRQFVRCSVCVQSSFVQRPIRSRWRSFVVELQQLHIAEELRALMVLPCWSGISVYSDHLSTVVP